MTGLAGLLDALLAARLAPRLDVLGIKAEATIGAPGPAAPIGKVENDVRLPSNAALDRQIPGAATGGTPHAASGAAPSMSARLSVAARVIGAVLAGVLAQTVSDSGLFYESHLASFAAGGRTLEQMKQEPQGRWAAPVPVLPAVKAEANALAVLATAAAAGTVPALADAPDALSSFGTQPQAQASAPQGNAQAVAAGASAPQAPVADASPQDGAQASGPAATNDAARVQAAYRQPGSAASGAAADSMPAHRASESARQADGVSAAPASRGAEVIHPQAVTIVHQQLDLLAGGVFRWNGQAWPDVPMSWSVEEEQAQPDARGGAASEAEAGARRWSTTVSLALPKLGEVDLRLSLEGSAVQAHLLARDASTMARLRGDTGRLAKRFDAAGLQLQQVLVAAKEAA